MRTAKEFFDYYHKVRWDLPGTYEERRIAELKMFEDWYREMDVGDRVHVKLYTDVNPATIIAKTKSTYTVRYDKATRDPNWKPEWIPGGFSAICTNDDDQKWIIEEDPNGATETFRWSKRLNCFQNSGVKLLPGWAKYYDYNF